MGLSCRKIIAIALVAVYGTTQIALGAIAESNVWQDRQRRLSAPKPSAPSPLLASLPSMIPFNRPAPNFSSIFSNEKIKNVSDLSGAFHDLISAVPAGLATVRDVYASGRGAEGVALIQDVHLNPEAQINIARTLQNLIDQNQIGMIGVEGAFRTLNFSPFRSFPDKTIAGKVSREFLDDRQLAAPSYVGITSPVEPPLIAGIDDKVHYKANVDAFLASRAEKAAASERLSQLTRRLAEEEKKLTNAPLLEFIRLRRAYRKNDAPFGAYVTKLSQWNGRLELNAAVELFVEAYDMEAKLDFARVEAERRTVLEKLTVKLNEDEVAALLALTQSYRAGAVTYAGYYKQLRALCERKGLPLSRSPHFEAYVRYLILSDAIKPAALLQEVAALEDKIEMELAVTEEEKEFVRLTSLTDLTGKLLNFELTPDEWVKYKKNKSQIPNPKSQANIKFPTPKHLEVEDFKFAWDLEFDAWNLSSFENFYREAEKRSESIVDNLLSKNVTGHRALVVGGFHTPEIEALLRKRNVSYVVIAPKLTKVDEGSGSSYLSVFEREKAPLDRLFAGEKLFVNPDVVNITDPNLALRLWANFWFLLNGQTSFEITVGGKRYRWKLSTGTRSSDSSLKPEKNQFGWLLSLLGLGIAPFVTGSQPQRLSLENSLKIMEQLSPETLFQEAINDKDHAYFDLLGTNNPILPKSTIIDGKIVISVPIGKVVLTRLDGDNPAALYSAEHYSCLSVDGILTRKDGSRWLLHAHIFNGQTDFGVFGMATRQMARLMDSLVEFQTAQVALAISSSEFLPGLQKALGRDRPIDAILLLQKRLTDGYKKNGMAVSFLEPKIRRGIITQGVPRANTSLDTLTSEAGIVHVVTDPDTKIQHTEVTTWDGLSHAVVNNIPVSAGTVAWFWDPLVRRPLRWILNRFMNQERADEYAYATALVVAAGAEGYLVWAVAKWSEMDPLIMAGLALFLIFAHTFGYYKTDGTIARVSLIDLARGRAPPDFWMAVSIALSSFIGVAVMAATGSSLLGLVTALFPHVFGNLIVVEARAGNETLTFREMGRKLRNIVVYRLLKPSSLQVMTFVMPAMLFVLMAAMAGYLPLALVYIFVAWMLSVALFSFYGRMRIGRVLSIYLDRSFNRRVLPNGFVIDSKTVIGEIHMEYLRGKSKGAEVLQAALEDLETLAALVESDDPSVHDIDVFNLTANLFVFSNGVREKMEDNGLILVPPGNNFFERIPYFLMNRFLQIRYGTAPLRQRLLAVFTGKGIRPFQTMWVPRDKVRIFAELMNARRNAAKRAKEAPRPDEVPADGTPAADSPAGSQKPPLLNVLPFAFMEQFPAEPSVSSVVMTAVIVVALAWMAYQMIRAFRSRPATSAQMAGELASDYSETVDRIAGQLETPAPLLSGARSLRYSSDDLLNAIDTPPFPALMSRALRNEGIIGEVDADILEESLLRKVLSKQETSSLENLINVKAPNRPLLVRVTKATFERDVARAKAVLRTMAGDRAVLVWVEPGLETRVSRELGDRASVLAAPVSSGFFNVKRLPLTSLRPLLQRHKAVDARLEGIQMEDLALVLDDQTIVDTTGVDKATLRKILIIYINNVLLGTAVDAALNNKVRESAASLAARISA